MRVVLKRTLSLTPYKIRQLFGAGKVKIITFKID